MMNVGDIVQVKGNTVNIDYEEVSKFYQGAVCKIIHIEKYGANREYIEGYVLSLCEPDKYKVNNAETPNVKPIEHYVWDESELEPYEEKNIDITADEISDIFQ